MLSLSQSYSSTPSIPGSTASFTIRSEYYSDFFHCTALALMIPPPFPSIRVTSYNMIWRDVVMIGFFYCASSLELLK